MLAALVMVGCGGGGNGGGGVPPLPPGDNANLSTLAITVAPLDQVFQPANPDYTASTGFLGAGTRVVATTQDPDATVIVDGVAAVSREPSQLVALAEGDTQITIEVTAEDRMVVKTYTVTVTRQTAASFAQRAYLKAFNVDAGDQFGHGIAVWEDTLAVGAVNEASLDAADPGDNSGLAVGAVYLFTRDGTGDWTQQAYLKAANLDSGDRFGDAVALFDDTLVVGAPGEAGRDPLKPDDNSGDNVGAVYVFVRDAGGAWSQQAYLKASNHDDGDEFGRRVALFAGVLVVGAPGENSDAGGMNENLADAGAVYVFERGAGGGWTETAFLKASNAGSNDRFSHVAISGTTIVVGAPGEDGNAAGPNDNLSNAGAVYVFERNGANWNQTAYLKASNAGSNDVFSRAAISGTNVVVGAPGQNADTGAAYVFERDGTGWTQVAFLQASYAGLGDEFGGAVAISNGTVVIGAPGEQSAATGVGGGAVEQADNSRAAAGAAYAFARDAAGNWVQVSYVKPSNTMDGLRFGADLALDRDTLGVTGVFESSGDPADQGDTSKAEAGAGYIFD